ncbi:hypothetical protein [Pseudonocardia sp.]|uniref:hypothetical protein n=1 Tax=Pseudonocardia sp. TaxID=60912 RepID=UPI00262505B7|nr:hypothetical protein [Pseudonocardia sp.]
MRARGVTYDTGFVVDGVNALPGFDPDVTARELQIIRDDLRCNAVRLTGGDPARLEIAATRAVDLGLEVWFSPYPLELPGDDVLALFADCAARAERVRLRGGEVVFVVGAELSLMLPGFLPGTTLEERVRQLVGDPQSLPERVARVSASVNEFLVEAVAVVRRHFTGRITYASIPLERVDWTPFDIVSVDLYRSPEVADRFAEGVRGLVAQGKPVAITEFGAATYQGASADGARGLEIVENDARGIPVRLKGEYVRDEEEQATCVRELLEIFDSEGVDSAFVFLFALHSHPHRPDGDPRDDLDLASYGIVKVLENRRGDTYPDMIWEPKLAFRAIAEYAGPRR